MPLGLPEPKRLDRIPINWSELQLEFIKFRRALTPVAGFENVKIRNNDALKRLRPPIGLPCGILPPLDDLTIWAH